LARVLLVGIDHAKRAPGELRTALEDTGRREIARMERFIEAMGTTASVEPLLGLLGTVIGMIRVFRQVVTSSRQGAVDPGMLANGIWQALITTAAGLAVAIVAFVGYRFLLSRTSRHAFVLEESAAILAESLVGPGEPAPQETQAE
jgi:biopolymer transport protein ExbB